MGDVILPRTLTKQYCRLLVVDRLSLTVISRYFRSIQNGAELLLRMTLGLFFDEWSRSLFGHDMSRDSGTQVLGRVGALVELPVL